MAVFSGRPASVGVGTFSLRLLYFPGVTSGGGEWGGEGNLCFSFETFLNDLIICTQANIILISKHLV